MYKQSPRGVLYKKMLLEKNCFIKKETLAQVFSSEIFNKTFSYRTPPVAVSAYVTPPQGQYLIEK